MKKKRLAHILTAAALCAAFLLVLVRNRRPPLAQPGPTPESAVYAMLDAAREGDVKKYLACYTGPLETTLRNAIAESGEQKFAAYLKESNAAIKGVAVMPPETISDREVKLRLEYVYQDRNEAQTLYLEKQGAVWRIARLEAAERLKTLIPYGTPVE
jgi:hypothetical protein